MLLWVEYNINVTQEHYCKQFKCRTKEGKPLRAGTDKDKSYCKSQIHNTLLRQLKESKDDDVLGCEDG